MATNKKERLIFTDFPSPVLSSGYIPEQLNVKDKKSSDYTTLRKPLMKVEEKIYSSKTYIHNVNDFMNNTLKSLNPDNNEAKKTAIRELSNKARQDISSL